MRHWLIAYADGTHYTDRDGPPESAPTGGVQVVYNVDESVEFTIEQSRFGYWGWRDDYGWVPFQTESGYWEYLFTVGIRKYPIFGRTLCGPAWHEAKKQAGEIATGLKKSGWWKVERQDDP